ncbi:MAG: VOC family protein [Chloroflexota bacterium]|nr:VOC family protein [Chloroflexota bacterium]
MVKRQPPIRYYGIAELALVVSDLQRSLDFYVGLLGFRLAPYDVGEGGRILRIGRGRYMGLWQVGRWHSSYLSPERNARYFGQRIGQTHPVFAIRQDDVPLLAERLRAAGHEIDGPMPHGDGSLHLYVSDPDGHALEFWGRRPSSRRS